MLGIDAGKRRLATDYLTDLADGRLATDFVTDLADGRLAADFVTDVIEIKPYPKNTYSVIRIFSARLTEFY
jgi:hypothetical protein